MLLQNWKSSRLWHQFWGLVTRSASESESDLKALWSPVELTSQICRSTICYPQIPRSRIRVCWQPLKTYSKTKGEHPWVQHINVGTLFFWAHSPNIFKKQLKTYLFRLGFSCFLYIFLKGTTQVNFRKTYKITTRTWPIGLKRKRICPHTDYSLVPCLPLHWRA